VRPSVAPRPPRRPQPRSLVRSWPPAATTGQKRLPASFLAAAAFPVAAPLDLNFTRDGVT
jgi:hypothetical protein